METLTLNYNSDTYTLRMLQSVEKDIVYKSLKYRIKGYEPDDLAQELRIHIYTKIGLYDPTKNASFRTWCDRVMRNKLSDIALLRSDSLSPVHAQRAVSIDDGTVEGIVRAYGGHLDEADCWFLEGMRPRDAAGYLFTLLISKGIEPI